MTIVITGEDRDALYERIVMRLNGIDDVYRAVEQEDWASAQELGLEFSDLLRFVCADLGWGERADESLPLSTPPDVLARAAEVLRDLAKNDAAHFESERRDAEVQENEARSLAKTCERLLREIQGCDE